MADTDLLTQLKREIAVANGLLLGAVRELTEQQVLDRPGGTLPSIAFHVWHSARWADYDREACGGGTQIWVSQGYAERWRLADLGTSDSETGTGLGDEQAAELVFPGKAEVVAYAEAAFGAFEEAIAPLAGDLLSQRVEASGVDEHSVQAVLFGQLAHVNRHLGMIEAIKGVQGLRGTATR